MNQRKRRLHSVIYAVQAMWDCLGLFLHDVFNPIDFLDVGFDGYISDRPSHASGTNVKNSAICTRKCPGCYQQLNLDRFLGMYTSSEFLYCLQCRSNGKPSTPYTAWNHPITTTVYKNNTVERQENHYGNRFATVRHADYYEIDVEDTSQFLFDPLVYGERYITWSNLSKESIASLKRRRRIRMIDRRGLMIPWSYSSRSESEFEQRFRDRCERLWRHGFDESLPDGLLKSKEWLRFWTNYENRDTLQCV